LTQLNPADPVTSRPRVSSSPRTGRLLTRASGSAVTSFALVALAVLAACNSGAGQAADRSGEPPAHSTGQTPAPQVPTPAKAAPPDAAVGPDYPVVQPRVVARHPHDTSAFTEGLVWLNGRLFESVGREGASDVRRVDLASGKVAARSPIPPAQFGEGLAAVPGGRELVSLTWHGGVAHRWDAATLKHRGTARFEGEGWGLTTLGRDLVQSDGTPTLRFLDPATLKVRRRATVTLNGEPLKDVNELEAVDGQILANVWHTPYLVRIDPATGRVTGAIDLSSLVAEVGATDPEAVANGVAWDAKGRRLFVTGKNWPTLYEVTVDWP